MTVHPVLPLSSVGPSKFSAPLKKRASLLWRNAGPLTHTGGPDGGGGREVVQEGEDPRFHKQSGLVMKGLRASYLRAALGLGQAQGMSEVESEAPLLAEF